MEVETVAVLYCEIMRFGPPGKCRLQLRRSHIFRQVITDLCSGPTTGKTRQSTVDSLTGGTAMRLLVPTERRDRGNHTGQVNASDKSNVLRRRETDISPQTPPPGRFLPDVSPCFFAYRDIPPPYVWRAHAWPSSPSVTSCPGMQKSRGETSGREKRPGDVRGGSVQGKCLTPASPFSVKLCRFTPKPQFSCWTIITKHNAVFGVSMSSFVPEIFPIKV